MRSARRKLEVFRYRKSDVISVERKVTGSGMSVITEEITMLIDDPLRDIGRFEQEFIYYRSRRTGPLPTVLVFPMFGETILVNKLAAKQFCRRGFNALIVMPRDMPGDTTRPLSQLNDMFVRYTIASRMAIDMLERFPEADTDRLFAYGVSMGGIRGALVFGADPRIRRAGLVLAGGDVPGIIADTEYRALRKVREANMAEENIPDLAGVRARLEEILTVDPLDFACLRAPEDVVMVISTGDRYVKTAYQEKLYDAYSRPQEGRSPGLIRSPVGHLATGLRFHSHVNQLIPFFEAP